MGVKPEKGVKVIVKASREAVFGEDDVRIMKIELKEKNRGVLTGNTIAGYCEVEMSELDGKKHWYPIDMVFTEKGEPIEEEDMNIDLKEYSD